MAYDDAQDWSLLAVDQIEEALKTGPDGLTGEVAARRLEIQGPNELEEEPPTSVFTLVLRQFQDPLIYILLVATAATLVMGEYIDAAVIAFVLALNAVIGFVQERQAENAIRALSGLVAHKARVRRGGENQDIESRLLVPGDLVLLESGQRVPADLRLVSVTGLAVDEAMLTGESLPVRKLPKPLERPVALGDRINMTYSGTVVTVGRARAYVVATGADTELGRIADRMRDEPEPVTPLQRRMARFARIIGLTVVGSALVGAAMGLAAGEDLASVLTVAVALAVSAVPEGLPVVSTITLAVGVRRMARRNAVIRNLPAVETLGSTSVIGSDKTGTLTENRMVVREIWTPLGIYGPDDEISPDGADPALARVHQAGILSSEASLRSRDDGYEGVGDPTEVALLVAAARMGFDPADIRYGHSVLGELPFEAERRYSAVLVSRDGRRQMLAKGAPEKIFDMCTHMESPDGIVDLDREAVEARAGEMAVGGLRVLAMAHRWTDVESLEEEPTGLCLTGLEGMRDPPRAGVAEAIEGCRQAGIRVVMITGDHAATAQAIAAELGIAGHHADVLTGMDIDAMDDDALREKARDGSVYARVSPEHKLRVVRALRQLGEVVAVTGDGVNDAPALRAADIGISMGRSGTDVAREASDMVLTDDNFVSIYAAVEEGRVGFDNLRKVTFFLISTGAAEILFILTALALGWPIPLVPAQILWLNLVTNGLQDVALAFEPGERDVLQRKPRGPREGIVSSLLWRRTVLVGAVMAAGTLLLFQWTLDGTGSLEQARTVALTTMVIFQAFHAGNARSDRRSLLAMSPVSNPFLFVAVLAAFGVHIGALHLPFTQFVLRVEPVPPETWIPMVGVALSVLVVVEVHKLIVRRRERSGLMSTPRTRH